MSDMRDRIIVLLKERGPCTYDEIIYGVAGLYCLTPADHVPQVIHALSELMSSGEVSGQVSRYESSPTEYYAPEPTEYAWEIAYQDQGVVTIPVEEQ